MGELTMKTLTELNAMTKAQLIASIVEGVTETIPVATRLPDGRLLKIEETTKDAYGVVKGRRKIDWTYYESESGKPVDEITTVEHDGLGKETNRIVIKHFTDGRQPVVGLLKVGQGQIEP